MTYTVYAAEAAREILVDLGINPDVDRYVDMVAKRIQAVRDEAIKNEVDRYTDVLSKIVADRDWWRQEAGRLRPVVDVAVAWPRYELRGLYVHDHDKALIDAVRAYQATSRSEVKTNDQA